MPRHHYISGDIIYPIGINMQENKSLILNMAHLMKRVIGGNTPVALWCMGSSGAIIAAIISLEFENCVINHVKKEGENSHSTSNYTTNHFRINIIVDDFIRSGRTVNAIYKDMKLFNIRIVDYLCVFESVYQKSLQFIPENVISNYYNENPSQEFIDKLISL